MTRRLHWGVGISLVYVLFATGTVGFVAFAMHQQIDLVSEDYYPQSLVHDARMSATARANALGGAMSVAFEPRLQSVVVTWPEAMRVEAGEVTLYRAADAKADRHVPAEPDGHGRQIILVEELEHGAWTVRVNWTSDGRAFFTERRLMLP